MRWKGHKGSENVEDRRSQRVPAAGLAMGGGVMTLVIIIIGLFMGVDPAKLLNNPALQQGGGNPLGGPPAAPAELSAAEKERGDFVSVVLAFTEEVWKDQFQKMRREAYQEPTLVLFRDGVKSGCGFASAQVGPFYCPADSKVYIDLNFFTELERRFKAPGDFAQAYVVAHEVGHHVQHLLGISDKVHQQQQNLSKAEGNELSVRLELQADFLAGVFAHHGQKKFAFLEEGDIDEALDAAHAIGDDTLQKQSQGRVVPDSFTHGTSEQRIRWFKRGFQSGDVSKMDDLFRLPYEQL